MKSSVVPQRPFLVKELMMMMLMIMKKQHRLRKGFAPRAPLHPKVTAGVHKTGKIVARTSETHAR